MFSAKISCTLQRISIIVISAKVYGFDHTFIRFLLQHKCTIKTIFICSFCNLFVLKFKSRSLMSNCSAPNLTPTSAELQQWTTVRGSIIIHIPTLSTTTLSLLYAIAIYSPGQQKKFNYSAPIRDIELKFWGYAQIALT